MRKRYHHFRRFAVGFYDPAFRELWYSRAPINGIYRAVVSVLAGTVVVLLAAQLLLMLRLLDDPRARAPWYNATGTSLYVLGMLVTAFALRPVVV